MRTHNNIHSSILKTSLTKKCFLTIGLACSLLMFYIDFDSQFYSAILLPVFFTAVIFSINKRIFDFGICCFSLISFYSFRMCIQPVILALGNFWLEPEESIYIDYYPYAILLTCAEFLIVILALIFYETKYRNKRINPSVQIVRNHSFYTIVTWMLTLLILGVIMTFHIRYFYFSLDQLDMDSLVARDSEMVYNTWYYIVDLLSGWCRPLLSFLIIYKLYKIYGDKSFWWIMLVALLNLAFTSDRRIFSIIVGGFCIFFMLSFIKKRSYRRYTYLFLLLNIIIVSYVLFSGYSEIGGNEMIARTVNRYFSGPTLTAMNLQMYDELGMQPVAFFKYLFNDFQILTGIFGKIPVTSDYQQFYGMSRGLWTPFVVGGLRYFGILFPIFIIMFVKFIVRMDYNFLCTNSILYRLIYAYLGVSVSCYMIMYMLELIVYFLLSTALLFQYIIYLDKRIKLKWVR